MKKIEYILLAFLCIMGFTACQDDLGIEGKGGVDLGSPAMVALNFGLPRSMEINVSRADNSKSQVTDIYLFIFDENGKYVGESEVTALTLKSGGEGVQYAGKATLYVGTQTIYAVANRLNMEYWNETTFTDLQKIATQGESLFLQVLYQLNNKIVQSKLPPGFSGERMPLSGQGEITVNESHQVQGSITLKRMVAQIKFKIHSKHDKVVEGYQHHVTFIPKSYTIYNIPQQSFVSENGSETIDEEKFYHSMSREISLPTGEEQIAYIDGFYLPENKQQAQKDCAVYNNREERSEDDYQSWSYAAPNGSYVVIDGRYTETQEDYNGNETLVKYADVSYTIHLGDFSGKNYSDFNVLRNNIYTYTVTVEGVDKIIVEANREDEDYQHGAEGDVIELTDASKMFNLDAHYEQVYVEYNLSDIARKASTAGGGNLEDRIKHNFLLSIHSPLNTVTSDKELVFPYGETISEEEGMAGIDYRWVEFYPQRGYKTISSYPGTDSSDLLSPWAVCQKMGDAVRQLCTNPSTTPNVNGLVISLGNDRNYYARFTVFVDEYFYTEDLNGEPVAWGDFTHKEDRTMMIASNMKISEDNHSTYSTAMTYITQKSIETFYNAQSDHYTNALGVEIYNESGSISGYGNYRASDWSNGRANMMKDIEWNDQSSWDVYLDWTQIGYTDPNTGANGNIPGFCNTSEKAYLACLSRNRDLNGDKIIQESEIRWYLPALSQYLRLGIGALSLSAEARLYTGDKSAMVGGYPENYINDGALYYHNTQGQGQYWAVEVGSYGTDGASSGQIRCVRNLPSEEVVELGKNSNSSLVGDEALAGPVYGTLKRISDGNYLFDFGDRLKDDMYRPTFQWGPYSTHHEESDLNHLPHAFVVSKDYTSTEYYMEYGWGIGNYDGTEDPCNTYSEKQDKSDRGAWRTPNLNELMVMSAGLKDKQVMTEASLCRTQFSNQRLRSGFYYNGKLITANSVKDDSGNYYWNNAKSRCVRDATEAERNSATEVQ